MIFETAGLQDIICTTIAKTLTATNDYLNLFVTARIPDSEKQVMFKDSNKNSSTLSSIRGLLIKKWLKLNWKIEMMSEMPTNVSVHKIKEQVIRQKPEFEFQIQGTKLKFLTTSSLENFFVILMEAVILTNLSLSIKKREYIYIKIVILNYSMKSRLARK